MHQEDIRPTATGPAPGRTAVLLSGLLGLVMTLGAIGLIGWNEWRGLRSGQALDAGARQVVSVASTRINPTRDGALVHVSGVASSPSPLRDAEVGLAANALRLERRVSMYQWRREQRETTSADSGVGGRYTYDAVWSDRPEDAGDRAPGPGGRNPEFPIKAASFTAPDARLGAFALDRTVLARADGATPLILDAAMQSAARQALAARSDLRPAHVAADQIYLGADPRTPKVGDVRITYALVPHGPFSVVARQSSGRLDAWSADGAPLILASSGVLTAPEMFQAARG